MVAKKVGRPRLDYVPGFNERFASILPALRNGLVSKGRAAKTLGISHRSLNRYLDNWAAREYDADEIPK